MLRNLFRFLVLVLVIALARYLIGMIMQALGRSGSPVRSNAAPHGPPAQGGELQKDPVCGTFVAAASSIKKTIRGETVHFCSAACRDKYPVS